MGKESNKLKQNQTIEQITKSKDKNLNTISEFI